MKLLVYKDEKRPPESQWVVLRKKGSLITLKGFRSEEEARKAIKSGRAKP